MNAVLYYCLKSRIHVILPSPPPPNIPLAEDRWIDTGKHMDWIPSRELSRHSSLFLVSCKTLFCVRPTEQDSLQPFWRPSQHLSSLASLRFQSPLWTPVEFSPRLHSVYIISFHAQGFEAPNNELQHMKITSLPVSTAMFPALKPQNRCRSPSNGLDRSPSDSTWPLSGYQPVLLRPRRFSPADRAARSKYFLPGLETLEWFEKQQPGYCVWDGKWNSNVRTSSQS